MTTTLFCCGDIHLGRRPGRLPATLADHGLDSKQLSPAAAWRRLVERALERRPAALVLAGDVVDSEVARYEAFGHLREGVERLAEAGVRVIAVAGNHDVEALPRLAEMIPGFHLLGRGGEWEVLGLETPGGGVEVELLGWSFPDRAGDPAPLASLRAGPLPASRLRLGLLHTELDGQQARYAPVAQGELAAAPVHAWLLGHLHVPTIDPVSRRPIGYLGSLVGLDPTEAGARGAWELRADPARGVVDMARLPLAPLRWERLQLDAGGLNDPSEELFPALQRAVAERHAALLPELAETLAVGCRVRLTGRTAHGPALRRAAAEIEGRQPVFPHTGAGGTVRYFLDRLPVDVAPARDLERLAEGHDPVALIARELIALERGDTDPALLDAARGEIRRAWSPSFDPSLDLPADPGDEEVLRQLRRAASEALDELLAQRENGS